MALVEEKEPWEEQALYIRVTNWAAPSRHSDTQRLHGSQATGNNLLYEIFITLSQLVRQPYLMS